MSSRAYTLAASRTLTHRMPTCAHRSVTTRFAVTAMAPAAAATYLEFLGWHWLEGTAGDPRGVYPPSAVVPAVFVLALLALASALLHSRTAGFIATTIGFVGCFAADADTSRNNDGLWPVGALLIVGGIWLGFRLVDLMVRLWRRQPR